MSVFNFLGIWVFCAGWREMTEIGLLEAFIVVHSGGLKMKSPVCKTQPREVSSGRMACAWSEGMFALLIYIRAEGVSWPLPPFLADPFPFTATFKAASAFWCPHPTSPSSVHEQLRQLCPLNTHSPAYDHSSTQPNLQLTSIEHFLVFQTLS